MNAYQDLIGCPYAEGGRGPKTFDCYGLAVEYNRRLGITLPDHKSTGTAEDNSQQVLDALAQGKWTKIEEPENGDLILFRIEGLMRHIGVCVEEGFFIHAVDGHNVCKSRLDHPLWEKRVVGFYRFAGMNDGQQAHTR